jgi:glycosyltransferase involved in cell wall biosynthesis
MDAAGCGAAFEERADILFVGGFRHEPNVDAVLFFVREVFPQVRARLGDVRFKIVGSHAPAEVRGLDAEGVEVVGYVPDLAPIFNRCRLSIAPLRYGAGIKGKVVMSMSFGVPCVTSPIAAEGMGLRDGEEVLIADGPQPLAGAVARLYTDGVLWSRLSAASLAFVERSYGREAARRRVREILTGVELIPCGGLAAHREEVRPAA